MSPEPTSREVAIRQTVLETRLARSEQTQSSTRWLDRLLLTIVILAWAVILSKNFPDPDLWGHVQYGRDTLRDGLAMTATYSYTAIGYPWINHELLAELAMAIGADLWGATGMLVAKCASGVAILGIMLARSRKTGIAPWVAYAVTLLLAWNFMHFWSMRPQILSYLLMVGLLVVIERGLAPWQRRSRSQLPVRGPGPLDESRGFGCRLPSHGQLAWLWLAPVIFAAWVNTHGAFVAGWAIFAVYVVLQSISMLRIHGAAAAGVVGHAVAALAASILATLLNPYGLEMHRWLLLDLGTPRPEIIEWRAPEMLGFVWLHWWALVLVWVGCLALSRERWDLTHVAIMALVLWQSVEHRRHIPFFVICFGFWMWPHVASAARRLRIGINDLASEAALPVATRLVLAITLVPVCVLLAWVAGSQFRQFPVKREMYPVTAFQYMADHEIQGNLVTRFMWTQYAIAAFGDRGTRVAFDGRFRTCYAQEMVDIYFDFAVGNRNPKFRHRSPTSPPMDCARILQLANPELVLIDRKQVNTVEVMNAHQDDWTLLYQDGLAQLWGRKEKYDDPDAPDFLPPERRSITDQPQVGHVPWPALPVVGLASRGTPTGRSTRFLAEAGAKALPPHPTGGSREETALDFSIRFDENTAFGPPGSARK